MLLNDEDKIGAQIFPNLDDRDYNENWYEHKAHVGQLLKQGAMGILGGMLYMLFVTGMSGFEDPSILLLGVFASIVLAGFPYGWSLLNRTAGNWNASGSLFFVACFYVIKAAIAFVIGIFIYPPVLVFNLIHSQKSKKRIFITWAVIVVSFLLFNSLIAVLVAREAQTYEGSYSVSYSETERITETAQMTTDTSKTETQAVTVASEPPKVVTVRSFTENISVLDSAIQKAMSGTKESENENASYGWTISEPTKTHGVFFLQSKSQEDPHYNIHGDVYVSNAIAVVSGYYVEEGSGIAINAWEMNIWFYPNYYFAEDGTLVYDTETVLCDNLRVTSMEEIMDWFDGSYSDMFVTELDIPES